MGTYRHFLIWYGPTVFWTILGALVVIAIIRRIRAGGVKFPDEVLSHWNQMIEELRQSSNEFYNEIASRLQKHELKTLDIRRVNLSQGGFFSPKLLALTEN